MAETTIDEINNTIRYTNYNAYRMTAPRDLSKAAQDELSDWARSLADRDITLRGMYDIRGFRGDTDLLLWIHARTAEEVQLALREFGQLAFGGQFTTTWSGMGLHRPAEFNRTHVPGFMIGKPAHKWLCVYPFIRSYDWYLLPEEERREMLVEHGRVGHVYGSVTSSTVASFALGDYEWLLALESDELHNLVDMMRDMRYTQARKHVREEVPFFTGCRIEPDQIVTNFS